MATEPLNAVVMVHKGQAHLADHFGPVWRHFGKRVVALDNADCPRKYAWADEVKTWPSDPGHHGIEQVRRHLEAVRLASRMTGPTAILEPDALVIAQMKVEEGVLYGSRLWDALDFKDQGFYVNRWFVHPPYVATQKTWLAIAEILEWWCKKKQISDDGQSDRIICLAAQCCRPGIQIEGVGFSRNTVKHEDLDELYAAIKKGVPIIHGIKNAEFLYDWLTEHKFMQPKTLWERFGVAPDLRKPPMAMDLLHVEMLHKAILVAKPKVAMEIGSFQGHSTVAFLAAMEELPDMRLHIVEPSVTPELKRLVQRSKYQDRITMHTKSSWEAGVKGVDLCYVDGCHMVGAMADTMHALSSSVPVIAMHDSQSGRQGIPGCVGSMLAADLLKKWDGRTWYEDAETRPGAWTHRGFAISSVKDQFSEVFSK